MINNNGFLMIAEHVRSFLSDSAETSKQRNGSSLFLEPQTTAGNIR